MFEEENVGNYGNVEPKSLIHTANISFATEGATVIVGRQPISLEWIGDYHEAAVAVLTYIPNTTIVAGYTKRKTGGESDIDEALKNFGKIGPKGDGAYVVDASVAIGEVATIGAYYMDAPDLFSAYGAKIEATVGPIGLLAKYATSDEDVVTTKDGEIYQLQASTTIDMFNASLGYIATDKTGAIGSLNALGDNINPFDAGTNVYSTDAQTTYGSVGATVAGISASALYGQIDYGTSSDKELDISLSAELAKNTSISALYVDIDAQGTTSDKDYYSLTLSYAF